MPCELIRVYMKKPTAKVYMLVTSMESRGESWLEIIHGEDCTHPKRRIIEERREDDTGR